MALCDELNSSITDISSQVCVVSKKGGTEDIASDKLHKRENHDQGGRVVIVSESASHETNSRTLALQSHQERSIFSISPEEKLQASDTGLLALPSSQEGSIPTTSPRKESQNIGSDFHASQPGLEGTSPLTREKAPDDGYNWRKYGQKNVKGNEYIRCYYKCTHPNCQVKRQVEHSQDGQIADTIYLGQHRHPKPQLYLSLPAGFVVPLAEDRLSPTSFDDKSHSVLDQTPRQVQPIYSPRGLKVGASGNTEGVVSALTIKRDEVHNLGDPDSKRQKKHNSNAAVPSVDKAIGEPRVIVQTVSEVDIVNDGFRWRKYGQKVIKGNANPRSYYRCSSPRCPVKKHVERASHDSKVVITTYEGQHDHDMPSTRTVTHNATCPNSNTTTQNGERCSKSGDGNNLCSDMVNHTSSGPESIERLNEESRLKMDMDVHCNRGHESEPNKQHISKSGTPTEESDALDMAGHSSSGTKSRPVEELKGELRTKSEEIYPVCLDMVHVIPGAASMSNEQQLQNAEPVQS